MTALYNEIDPFAADYLENLIAGGVIAPGIVDRRSIAELTPAYVAQFTQCHFFAGIGVWSYALRCAGWPDDRPVWTGSPPCQPFSGAGKREGFDDKRHLWPAWDFLIGVARPVTVLGEQVANGDGLTWFDLVSADMEGKDYTAWALDTCAAGVGAPEWRQRLYYGFDNGQSIRQLAENGELGGMAYANHTKWRANRSGRDYFGRAQARWEQSHRYLAERGRLGRMADTVGEQHDGSGNGGTSGRFEPSDGGEPSELDDAFRIGRDAGRRVNAEHDGIVADADGGDGRMGDADEQGLEGRLLDVGEYPGQRAAWPAGVTGGFWSRADAIWCRAAVQGEDGFWRPVEQGSFPLANEPASVVGELRAYGNAIVAENAIAIVECYLAEEDDAVREFVEDELQSTLGT